MSRSSIEPPDIKKELWFDDRFLLIAGFLVDTVQRAIVSKTFALSNVQAGKKVSVKHAEIWSHFNLDLQNSPIVKISYPKLFRYIDTKNYNFVEFSNGIIAPVGNYRSKKIRGKIFITKTFSTKAFRYHVTGSTYVYIQPTNAKNKLVKTSKTEEKQTNSISPSKKEKSIPTFTIHKTQQTSKIYQELKLDDFHITSKDYDFLKTFQTEKENAVKLGEKYLLSIYKLAFSRSSDYIEKKENTLYTSTIGYYDRATLKVYGRKLAFPLFLLLNSHKLSFFPNDKLMKGNVLNKLSSSSKYKTIIKYLAPLFRDSIEKNYHQDFLLTWIRLCAVDFEIKDKLTGAFHIQSSICYKYVLEAIRCLITFSALAYSDDIAAISKQVLNVGGPSTMFRTFMKYCRLIDAEATTEAGGLSLSGSDNQSLSLGGMKISLDDIFAIKLKLYANIEEQIIKLSTWLTFKHPQNVYIETLGNRSIKLKLPDEDGNNQSSLYDELPQRYFRKQDATWKNLSNNHDDTILQEIANTVNEITYLLMCAVWINPGYPLRFPELSILSIAGPTRNLFIEDSTRKFYIRSYYNKFKRDALNFLFLDTVVSSYLLWLLYVIKPFFLDLLNHNYKHLKASTLAECLKIEMEQNVPGVNKISSLRGDTEDDRYQMNMVNAVLLNQIHESINPSSVILNNMVFMDTIRGSLISSESISAILQNYFQEYSEKDKYSFETLRECLILMWEYFIQPPIFDIDMLNEFHHSKFGTSKRKRVFHKIDDLLPSETHVPFDYYYCKGLCQDFHLRTSISQDHLFSEQINKKPRLEPLDHSLEKIDRNQT